MTHRGRGNEEGPAPSGGAPEGGGTSGPSEKLDALRARILELDEELVRLVGERRSLVIEIGLAKEASGSPVLDPAREATVVRRAAQLARDEGVDEEMVRDVIWRIIASAREEQEHRSDWGPPAPPTPTDSG